ncbi:MAG: hypothetical protein LV481_16005 [Methylacidiphilales bacterium]|nr:hypothetical protein [Candidatus Methylacidiphilales bacterium]
MSAQTQARRGQEMRHAVLEFLAARQAVAFEPEIILERVIRSRVLDFHPEPDELTAALTFLEQFSPEPLIACRRDALGSSRFYQATSAGVLAWERGALNP